MFVFLFAVGALPSLKRGWRHKFLLLVLDFVSKEERNFRESGKFVRFCENLLLLMTQCEKSRQDLFSRTEKKKNLYQYLKQNRDVVENEDGKLMRKLNFVLSIPCL